MKAEERADFERQVSVLCAAFGVPVGDRADTLWRAFNGLGLVEFTRIVDRALSADCTLEKFPTVRQLWGLRRMQSGNVKQAQSERSRPDMLTEAAISRFQLSEWQCAGWHWSFIWRDPHGPGCECLGLIIPQDAHDPERYPAHRLLWSDCHDARLP